MCCVQCIKTLILRLYCTVVVVQVSTTPYRPSGHLAAAPTVAVVAAPSTLVGR